MLDAERSSSKLSKLARPELYSALLLSAALNVRCAAENSFQPIFPDSSEAESASDKKIDLPPTQDEEEKVQATPKAKSAEPKRVGKFDVYSVGDTPASETMQGILKKAPGNRWCGKLEGNGKRDVAIYMPHAHMTERATEFIYHFHGSKGQQLKRRSNSRNRLEQVIDSSRFITDRNAVIVYPLSGGKRGHSQSRDMYWMNKKVTKGRDDIQLLHRMVQSVLEGDFGIKAENARVTVRGHSSGGRAIANLSKGLPGSGFKVDRMDFLDASYANWASSAYQHGAQSNPNLEMNLFIIPDEQAVTTTSSPDTTALIDQRPKGLEVVRVSGMKHGELPCAYSAWDRNKKTVLDCEEKGWNKFKLKSGSVFE